jgi:hypothetical protein
MDVAPLDEHLTVFLKLDEALERFLEEFESSSHEPYKISTSGGTLERTSRAQISDAVDALGGSLNALEVWYVGPDRRVNLDVRPYAASPVYRIGCAIHVFGDDENETNGRFDTLRNRMDAVIKREWPKPTAAKPETAPSGTPSAASAPTASPSSAGRGFKLRLDAVLRHPLWSAIIAGLVVIAVVAVWSALT